MPKIGVSQETDFGETQSLFGFLKMDKKLFVLNHSKNYKS